LQFVITSFFINKKFSMEIMKLKVRKVGNSKGIVIPHKFLKIVQRDKEKIELEEDEKGILLKSTNQSPSKGWAKAFKRMAKTEMINC
jgi:antitoxin component of MazEF toxin-antitoxin module